MLFLPLTLDWSVFSVFLSVHFFFFFKILDFLQPCLGEDLGGGTGTGLVPRAPVKTLPPVGFQAPAWGQGRGTAAHLLPGASADPSGQGLGLLVPLTHTSNRVCTQGVLAAFSGAPVWRRRR